MIYASEKYIYSLSRLKRHAKCALEELKRVKNDILRSDGVTHNGELILSETKWADRLRIRPVQLDRDGGS